MTLFFADLVREVSSSAGAGDFVLGGAVPGHRRFAGIVPAGARFHYAIAGVTRPEEWETGEGALGSGGSLVRAPLASSAGGGLVAFSPGLKTVALIVGAAWFKGREEAVTQVADVQGLTAALDGKAAAAHDHTGVYAPASHGHDGVYALAAHHHDGLYQPADADLSAIAALASAADLVPYATGPGSWALASFTGFGRSLAGSFDAAAARAALALGGMAVQQPNAVAITGGTIGGVAGIGTTGAVTSSAALLLSGTAGGEQTIRAGGTGSRLVLEQIGGTFGTSRLTLVNEAGQNGAVFETTDPTTRLVDLQFRTSAADVHTLRYERRAAAMLAGNSSWEMQFGTTGTPTMVLGETGLAIQGAAGVVKVGGAAVLGPRRTGWTAPTGVASRGGYATGSATIQQLAETLTALIDDLAAHGLIGA